MHTIANDPKGLGFGYLQRGKSYPWDGKLVQDLVKKRTQAFEKAVK